MTDTIQESNTDERKKEAGARAGTYAFLSGLFSRVPSEKLISMILDKSILDEIGDDDLAGGCREFAEFVDGASSIPNLALELSAEYTHLFVLPTGVRPYESVFVDEKSRLGGAVTVGVKRFYRHAGAELLSTCLDVPDHIGIELEFMSFLCAIEGELWENPGGSGLRRCAQIQKEFLEGHLLRWIDPFCAKVREMTSCKLYRALALLTADFLKKEEEHVGELILALQRQTMARYLDEER